MRASDIYTWVSENLSDLLGTYTYPNGHSKPAISIGNPLNEISFSGSLEVVIPLTPSRTKSIRTGAYFHREDYWDIYLIQRDRSGNVVIAAERMLTSFIQANAQDFPVKIEGETFPSVRLTIIHKDTYQSFRGI